MQKLTRWILIALVLGAVTGLTLNLTFPPVAHGWVRTWLTEGLFLVVGRGFVALLTMLVVPMVFVSITAGTAALDDVRALGRIGVRTLGWYLLTTALAVSLAVSVALWVQPGAGFSVAEPVTYQAKPAPPLTQVLLDLFPANPVRAMAEGNMLQVIGFSILLGVALTLAGAAGKRVGALFQDLNEVVLRLVGLVMWAAPVGVFALLARTLATQGFQALPPLAAYFGCVLGCLLVHGLGVYGLLLKLFGRVGVRRFFRGLREVHLFAFSTASSNATIPVTLRAAEALGVPRPIAAFSIPLGATVNMDGTAIMQGVASVFLAQVYGVPLDLQACGLIVATATLASVGTAGVPGVGLVMLAMVLQQVGVPVEGIALILGVDRLLDMVRTAVNVTGDVAVACVVSGAEAGDRKLVAGS